jgi:hypothetical protein
MTTTKTIPSFAMTMLHPNRNIDMTDRDDVRQGARTGVGVVGDYAHVRRVVRSYGDDSDGDDKVVDVGVDFADDGEEVLVVGFVGFVGFVVGVVVGAEEPFDERDLPRSTLPLDPEDTMTIGKT